MQDMPFILGEALGRGWYFVIRSGGRKMTEAQQDQIKNLCQDGLGYRKIAAVLELSENTVKSYCRRHGLECRKTVQISKADVCHECGAKLYNTPGHRQRSFCSDECRKKYWKGHQALIKRGNQKETTCPICGGRFHDYARRKRKYCSQECYQQSRKGGTK